MSLKGPDGFPQQGNLGGKQAIGQASGGGAAGTGGSRAVGTGLKQRGGHLPLLLLPQILHFMGTASTCFLAGKKENPEINTHV